jgi:hypothetical protein
VNQTEVVRAGRFRVARCSCGWSSEPCMRFGFAFHLAQEHACDAGAHDVPTTTAGQAPIHPPQAQPEGRDD